MRIVRPERELREVALRFEVAPAYDLVISLAAAANPDRFELSTSWARSVRQALPPPLRQELTFFFGDALPLGVGAIDLIPELPDTDPETLLRRIGSMDAPDFVAVLLSRAAETRTLAPALQRLARGASVTPADEDLLASHLAGLKADTRKRFRAIMQGAADAQRRYCALLQAHAAGWFTQHYGEILPILLHRAKQGRRSIGKLPTKEVIARVTGGFTLQDPEARSVQLTPSYYAAPFVFVVGDAKDVVLVYGARPAAEEGMAPVDAQTVRVLKALSDETRLRILQLLTRRPLYGQQLAEALGVSHPTISHHMAQLRIAGLTRTELAEDGNKTYSVRPETIEEVCAELRAAFVDPELRGLGGH